MSLSEQSSKKKPDSSPSAEGDPGSMVRMQSIIQLALMLPAAVVVGYFLGLALDHWLHQHWINIAGLLLGAAAGLVQMFRVVLAQTKE
jgi:ATP synthase protein I